MPEVIRNVKLGDGGVGLSYEARLGLGLLDGKVELSKRITDTGSMITVAKFDPQEGERVIQTLTAATANPNGAYRLFGIEGDWNLIEKPTDPLWAVHKEQMGPLVSAAFEQFVTDEVPVLLELVRATINDPQRFLSHTTLIDGPKFADALFIKNIWKPEHILKNMVPEYIRGVLRVFAQQDPKRFRAYFDITDTDIAEEEAWRTEQGMVAWQVIPEIPIVLARYMDSSLAIDPNARNKKYDYERLLGDETEGPTNLEYVMRADQENCMRQAVVAATDYYLSLPDASHWEAMRTLFQLSLPSPEADGYMNINGLKDLFPNGRVGVSVSRNGRELTITYRAKSVSVLLDEKPDDQGIFKPRSVRIDDPERIEMTPVLAWETYRNQNGQTQRRLLSIQETRDEVARTVSSEKRPLRREREVISPYLGRAVAVALTPEMQKHIPSIMKNPVSGRKQKIEAVQIGVLFADAFAPRTLQWLDPLFENLEKIAV